MSDGRASTGADITMITQAHLLKVWKHHSEMAEEKKSEWAKAAQTDVDPDQLELDDLARAEHEHLMGEEDEQDIFSAIGLDGEEVAPPPSDGIRRVEPPLSVVLEPAVPAPPTMRLSKHFQNTPLKTLLTVCL